MPHLCYLEQVRSPLLCPPLALPIFCPPKPLITAVTRYRWFCHLPLYEVSCNRMESSLPSSWKEGHHDTAHCKRNEGAHGVSSS